MKGKIEILAPAGSYESMRAAMNAGCDAVYIGGASFGARAYAGNPDKETLLRAIEEAHIRNKSLYLTVNTLLKEEELETKLYSYLKDFYEAGLDAVIVQDPGVMRFIHKNFPGLPIHASTQTTITMAQGANLLKTTGVTRLVTARELSLKEISTLRENTNLELETFVHGALCYCYSGQCLMSSIIGGRSGNRGRCAQPCRMPYRFFSDDKELSKKEESYLLSPKDIHTTTLIPELIEAGVQSFKIEGRMKRPEYAAGVTAVYRKCTDLYLEYGRERYEEYLHSPEYTRDRTELMDLYNRGGFSEGYGKTYHSKNMMSLSRPNHSGVYVGEVTAVKKAQAIITLAEQVNAQDILEIRGNSEYEFTLKGAFNKGEALTVNVGRVPSDRNNGKSDLNAIYVGASVYRTKNNMLLERIKAEYLDRDARRYITGLLRVRLGERLSLTLTDGNITVSVYHNEVPAAEKQPMTREKLEAPILKLGDTLYIMKELDIEADEGVFVPVAWLNELRREAIQKLQRAVIDSFRREKVMKSEQAEAEADKELEQPSFSTYTEVESIEGLQEKPYITVAVRTYEQFLAAVSVEGVTLIFADYEGFSREQLINMSAQAHNMKKGFYPMLPHICRQRNLKQLREDVQELWSHKGITGFIVKNYEEAALLLEISEMASTKKEIILNYNMYVYNNQAKGFWLDRGISHFTAPIELNSGELKALGIRDCDLMVYGHLPLMVSAQCLHESTAGCSRCKSGEQRTEYLTDRMGKSFYVQTNCNGCYNVILNGMCLTLLRYMNEIKAMEPRSLRLDFTIESAETVTEVIAAFLQGYYDNKQIELSAENLTAGHFKRGVE